MKYTPGPWNWGKYGLYTTINSKGEYEVVFEVKGHECGLSDIKEGDKARIAAAPELLVALELLIERCNSHLTSCGNAGLFDSMTEQARALLAQVKGE